MRVDPAEAGQRRAWQGQQVMDDRQLDLADDRQVVLEQQVVVPVDAAANRVLDRQHAVGDRAGLHRVEGFFEAPAGQQVGVGVNPAGGGFAEGARLALIRDFHRRRRLHTPAN